MYVYTTVFSRHFKGNNFGDSLFVSLENEALNMESALKFFPSDLTPTEKIGKTGNDRVASSQTVPIYLKTYPSGT